MSREAETYRPILEQILETTNGQHVLSVTQCMAFTGRGREWIRQNLGICGQTTAENLAMKLAKL